MTIWDEVYRGAMLACLSGYLITLVYIMVVYKVERLSRAIVFLMLVFFIFNIGMVIASFAVSEENKKGRNYYDFLQVAFILDQSLFIYFTFLI